MISEHQGQFAPPAAEEAARADLTALTRFLQANETRLIEMHIAYSITRSYNAHVSTLPEAWRASVQGLNGAIALMLETRGAAEADYDSDIGGDPSTAYGIEVARRHGLRGVPLAMFLSNFKGYRDSYLRLVQMTGFPAATETLYLRLLRGFFDRAEIGICTQWGRGVVDAGQEQLLAENQRVVTEKNKYLTIFESIQTPVFLIDAEGAIENMNHAAALLLSKDVVPGSVYYGAAARRSFQGLFGLDPRGIGPLLPEHEIDTIDGRRWVSVSTQEMLDVSRKFLGTVISFTDVTDERRAREEAEALARAKTDFLATMSHEIRTPIHSIGGIVELLRQDDLPPRAAGYVEAIDRSARVLTSIVSEILDYSRIEAGGMMLERVDFPLGEVTAEVARVIEPLVARKPGLVLHVDAPADLPCVSGDPAKLRQILLNLAGNAVKFTEAGAVVIGLDLISRSPGRVLVRFSVRDTGPGIASERLEQIFRPFTQSDSSIERKHGGTGLGLAISRRLAELMGAELTVESHPGEGSCFRLAVSLDLAARQGADCARARAKAQALPAKALRLLIVEDDAVNRLVTETLLRQAGHQLRLAETGEAALQALAGQAFDLVLTDLNLPDLSGFDLGRAIRAHADPAIARLPIAALSAHGPAVDAAALAAAGIGGFLAKPFAFARLEDLLRRLTGFASPRPVGSGGPLRDDGAGQGAGLVDLTVLRGHAEALGTGPTGRIVATFKASLGHTAAALETAVGAERWNEVAMIAHRLKSSARHVGLRALAEEAERAEMLASASGRRSADLAGPVADLVLSCRSAVGLVEAIWAEIAG
ncbi:ATP-binding protein [Rhodobacter capsulatus]|uniref:histidine kinase n=5 Tax=Rhodobacter capsulatus TaxID=1061 RepID=D5APK9_RHOCB|nr:ATP-binding protein [Rhodobacter capsulatus]ADE86578.1 DMSO/TMAO-sensor hybrid histidine kinase [Rhodobacter capsulatus SB 1003]ETD00807.1 ATPase [Rhodobacter capsulatus DE442]ETE52658.1 ATPase [Rhodobacter capsulatus Y262]MDS0928384.1 ATP-binding protein [Rhodobacter capsulatus]TQD35478.1 response regulator [Rhodobacter capsulatus]